MVMKQLEGQRNDLCAFAKADLKNEVPSHFEMQRAEREQLRAQVAELKTQVESANMRAAEMASGRAGAVGSPANMCKKGFSAILNYYRRHRPTVVRRRRASVALLSGWAAALVLGRGRGTRRALPHARTAPCWAAQTR